MPPGLHTCHILLELPEWCLVAMIGSPYVYTGDRYTTPDSLVTIGPLCTRLLEFPIGFPPVTDMVVAQADLTQDAGVNLLPVYTTKHTPY